MIELVPGFPDNVVGCQAKGQVTASDYDDVLIPAVEAAFKRHDKIRFYYELGPEFTGMDPVALWEDFKVGMRHLAHWERVAVVTDFAWLAQTVHAFRFFIPCPVRVFGTDERTKARAWITEQDTGKAAA